MKDAYVITLCVTFALVGLWHILAADMTERIFSQPKNVRLAGIALVVLALPCALWSSPYFLALGAILLASGVLRALNPDSNVKLQKNTLPRWGHGCVIGGFAFVCWVSYAFNFPRH